MDEARCFLLLMFWTSDKSISQRMKREKGEQSVSGGQVSGQTSPPPGSLGTGEDRGSVIVISGDLNYF